MFSLRVLGRHGELAGYLAHHAAEFPLELPDAGFVGVVGDHFAERLVADLDLFRQQAAGADGSGQQELAGDVLLLVLRVARELHRLHPVAKRRRDVLDEVRGGDEQHLAQVVGHAEVVVDEGAVLRRVQDLEQRGRRIALERGAQLVHLVEQEHRVLDAGLLHAVEDAARHRADVGAPVPADVRLVPGAAQGDAHVLASHGAGDRLRDRGFADTGRSREEENRAAFPFGVFEPRLVGRAVAGTLGTGRGVFVGCFPVALPSARLAIVHDPHREELQDPVLRILEAVVVLVQDARRVREVQPFVAEFAPRQLAHRLDVGADDLGFHRLAAHPLESPQFAVDFLPRRWRQLQPGDPLFQFLEVFASLVVAEFLADGLQLFAQVHLALAVADLLLDLAVDVLLGVENLDPPLDQHQHPPHPLFDGERLEQGLVVAGRQLEMTCYQVGEPPWVVHRAQRLVEHVAGDAGALTEFSGPVAEFLVEGNEGKVIGVHRHEFLRRRDGGEEMLLRRVDAQCDAAVQTLDEGLRAAEALLELDHARNDADGVQAEGIDILALLPLQEGEEPAVRTLGRGLDGAQGVRPSNGHGHGDAWIDHQVTQDDDRQLRFGAGRSRRKKRVGGRLGGQGLGVGLLGAGQVVVFGHLVVPRCPVRLSVDLVDGTGLARDLIPFRLSWLDLSWNP